MCNVRCVFICETASNDVVYDCTHREGDHLEQINVDGNYSAILE